MISMISMQIFLITVVLSGHSASSNINIRVRSDLIFNQPCPSPGDLLLPMSAPETNTSETNHSNSLHLELPTNTIHMRQRSNGTCVLMKDGFSFYRGKSKSKKTKKTQQWRCSRNMISKCKAKINELGDQYTINGEHNAACRQMIKTRCIGTIVQTKSIT